MKTRIYTYSALLALTVATLFYAVPDVSLRTLGALVDSSSQLAQVSGGIPQPGAYKPDDTTTGPNNIYVKNKASLQPSGWITVTEPGTVIENVDITGGVNVKADNVTIRNFKLKGTSYFGIRADFGAKNLVIEDGEITDAQSAGVYGSNFTARRLNIHNMGNDAYKPFRNVVIEAGYAHHLGYISDSHADGVQMVVGGKVVARGNNFDMNVYTQPGFHNSQVFIIQPQNGPIDDVLIEKNWINGGGTSIQLRDKGNGPPTNVRILNNYFGRDYRFGPWIVQGSTNVRMCNVWEDTGELLSGQAPCDEKIELPEETPTPPITPEEPTLPTPAFSTGDRIEVTKAINVRTEGLLATYTLKGTNPKGTLGTVIGGPTYSPDPNIQGKTIIWYNIDYDTGTDGWSGEDNLTASNTTKPTEYTLVIEKEGDGAGVVTSSGGTISCGNDCEQTVTGGASGTLTATPSAGSTFTGWSGVGCSGTGPCQITVTKDITITATFEKVTTQSGDTITVSNATELTNALNNATGGETILLQNGNYGRLLLEKEYSDYVTIRSANGNRGAVLGNITIDGSSHVRIDNVEVAGGGGQAVYIINGSEYIDILNSDIHGPLMDRNNPNYVQLHRMQFVIRSYGPRHIRIEGNDVHDANNGPTTFGGSDITIRNNNCDYVASDCFKFAGVSDVLFENNVGAQHIYSAPDAHVDFMQAQGSVKNGIFRGNVAIMGTRSFQGLFFGSTEPNDNVLVENNVIYTTHARGISFNNNSTNITIRYNTVLNATDVGGEVSYILGPGNRQYNVMGRKLGQAEISGTNYTLQDDDPDHPLFYDKFYQNATKGPGLTIEDLHPVAGSPADGQVGAYERIYELLGEGTPVPTPTPTPTPTPEPVPASEPTSGDLLENGTFESFSGGTAANWIATGPAIFSLVSDTGYTGLAQRINLTTPRNWGMFFYQRPLMVLGKTYTWSFWYKTSGSNTLYAEVTDGPHNNVVYEETLQPTNGTWQKITRDFTYTNNAADMVRMYATEAGSYWVDDMTLLEREMSNNETPPTPDTFSVGDPVRVTPVTPGANLNVRVSPNGAQVGQQQDGATGTVSGGPTLAGDFWWWQVNFQNNPDGWVAENFITAYIPTTSQPDEDGDGVPDTADRCPSTPSQHLATVNQYGCPKPAADTFDIKPDFDTLDPTATQPLEIGDSDYGKVGFANTDVSFVRDDGTPLNLDEVIVFEPNRISIDTDKTPELNQPATLTFYNVTVKNPLIKRDGEVCTVCLVISYKDGTLVVAVPGFSTYEVVEEEEENTEEDNQETSSSSSSSSTGSSSSSGGGGSSSGGGGGGSAPRSSGTQASPAQIASLVSQLQTLVNLLESLGGTVSPSLRASVNSLTATYAPSSGATFYRNLTIGSRGEDVRALQRYLNQQGFVLASTGAGAPGQETTYFGPKTRAALAAFQSTHAINPPVGYFGPITRGYVQS